MSTYKTITRNHVFIQGRYSRKIKADVKKKDAILPISLNFFLNVSPYLMTLICSLNTLIPLYEYTTMCLLA